MVVKKQQKLRIWDCIGYIQLPMVIYFMVISMIVFLLRRNQKYLQWEPL